MIHEADLVRAILIELGGRSDVLVYRANVVVARDRRRAIRSLPTGHPDIIAVRRGLYYGIEAKSDRGKLSRDQFLFARALARAGGIYILAHSVEDVVSRMFSDVAAENLH